MKDRRGASRKYLRDRGAKADLESIGAERFAAAYDAAMLALKGDPRFTGLTKIRAEMAREAALRGTGFPFAPFTLSRKCGAEDRQMLTAIDETMPLAIKAARRADRKNRKSDDHADAH